MLRPFYSDFEPTDCSRAGTLDHYAEEHRACNRWEDTEQPQPAPTTTDPKEDRR